MSKDEIEPLEVRISRLESTVQELIDLVKLSIHIHYYPSQKINYEEELKRMNKPPIC